MKLCRKKVDWVVEKAYREGFMSSVYGAIYTGLEYASTSGLYSYNPIRAMAYDAGRAACEEIITKRGTVRFVLAPDDIAVPGEVWIKAYGLARLSLRRSK